MIWYLAVILGLPIGVIVIVLALDVRRRRRARIDETESAYGAKRDLYDETVDSGAAERKALRDIDLYAGARRMHLPRGK